MNKRNNTIRGVLLLVAAALMFSSCAETPGPEEEVTDTRTISFGTPALTRSAIDNAGDMQKEENAFSVWGWYANAGGTESGTVFNNKRVFWSAANPGWGYEDTRYWHPGLDYRFYALYPSTDKLGTGVNAACAVNGTITITNFDATHGTDLMTAQQTVQTPDVLTKDPGPVTFTFAHQLARLSFAVKAVGCEATVTAFKVNGVTWKANLTCPASGTPSWSGGEKTTDGTEDEYATLENRINTLRVLVVTDGNKIAVNHKLTPEELAAQTVTIENVPVGKVTFCVLANEAALGKDYDTEEFELVDVPGRTSKKALLEDPDRTYFPKWFSEVNIDKGLPMSWIVRDYEVKSGSPTGTPGEPLEAQLVRCVAKLNISMNNDLDSEINIKAVNFGTFFGDRLYLFGEQSLDVPGSTAYEAKSYPYETEADYIKIPAYGEKMLVCYIYPSYAWLPEMTDSPYTIGFATLAKGTYPQKAFIAEGALKSIARNTQVNIRATLSVDARLILKYEVVDWGKKEITVPPFN